ncbi:histidine phosphatase family protein [Flavihumibacter profundi]|uniref:histidine phosphatase family protein n=1 Tax=Flavihumibacter profundi TaxID=2716883 RepID=UPI001CC4BE68|nr:histidine phosphatase family protein [Flavihumibacter profundi]MBZ5857629.1 histidine phosphatase family protein [Flavihumibacter profundi]
MKPKRIILIRHGQSEGNVEKAMYNRKPDYALLLTNEGKSQARKAGEQLKSLVGNESLYFYVSPLFRTRQTFAEIANVFPENFCQMQEEPRIREQEWGHLRTLEECNAVERSRDAFGTFYFRIPDGESAADVFDRVSDFFNTLFRDFEKPDFAENAVVVTHGMTIRLFLMRWFHYTVEEFEELANPKNCDIVVMEKQENGKYALLTTMRKHHVMHQWRLD